MTLKPIDKNQTLYHLFKLSTVLYALYDDEMDMPIQYGSLNLISAATDSIRKNIKGVKIIYYDRDLSDKITLKRNDTKTRVNNPQVQ